MPFPANGALTYSYKNVELIVMRTEISHEKKVKFSSDYIDMFCGSKYFNHF